MADAVKGSGNRRRGGVRAIGATVAALTRKAVGQRGFAHAAIITDWPLIVGEELARTAQPERLSYPAGKRNGATLHIRAAGPVAMALAHLEPIVIERINRHFGYRAVERIRLMQAPLAVARQPRDVRKPTRRPLEPEERRRLDRIVAGVEDSELRLRLDRLGEAILQRAGNDNS